MNCKNNVIAAVAILSLSAFSHCGSDSSSSDTGYQVGISDSITQLTVIPPVESFTASGPAPYTTFATADKNQHASVVLKTAVSNLGFAVGEYHKNGQLLYKMVSIFTISSATYTVGGKFILPNADNPSITYTLTNGSSTLLVTDKNGLAPSRFTATGTSVSATVTLTAAATSTTPATYSVSFTPSLSPSFSGASCTLSAIALSSWITI